MIPELYTKEEVIEYIKPHMKRIIQARQAMKLNRSLTQIKMPSVFSAEYLRIWDTYVIYYYGIRCCEFEALTGDLVTYHEIPYSK